MNCLRIFADENGESHFDEIEVSFKEVAFAPPAPPFLISEPIEAKNLIFLSFPSQWFGDWHPSPAHQYFFLLSGRLEAEVSDGEIRQIEPGAAVLLEDTVGKGHVTRVLGEDEVQAIFVQLPAGGS